MGILDNLESYLEKAEETAKCYFCEKAAKYDDVAEVDQCRYDVVGVCECHSFKGLSS
jgi:hypothetical protein